MEIRLRKLYKITNYQYSNLIRRIEPRLVNIFFIFYHYVDVNVFSTELIVSGAL